MNLYVLFLSFQTVQAAGSVLCLKKAVSNTTLQLQECMQRTDENLIRQCIYFATRKIVDTDLNAENLSKYFCREYR
jgi:hypothetical protein